MQPRALNIPQSGSLHATPTWYVAVRVDEPVSSPTARLAHRQGPCFPPRLRHARIPRTGCLEHATSAISSRRDVRAPSGCLFPPTSWCLSWSPRWRWTLRRSLLSTGWWYSDHRRVMIASGWGMIDPACLPCHPACLSYDPAWLSCESACVASDSACAACDSTCVACDSACLSCDSA